jgi:hypothetical protein
MATLNFRDAYEFGPETYGRQSAGGLPEMIERAMREEALQRAAAPGSSLNARPEYDSSNYEGLQGGLLGRLLALQAKRDRYWPISQNVSEAPLAEPYANERLRHLANVISTPIAGPSLAEVSASSQATPQYEAEQAQQAREAAAARLARGVRNLSRVESPRLDPIDISRSIGIGAANGAIGLLGEIPQVSDWAHRAANSGIDTAFNAISGPPRISPPPPNINVGASPEHIKKLIEEKITGKFYQPKSTAGRYAETIGEMVPAALGQGVGAFGQSLARGASGAALRDLGGKLITDAVVPGVAVQALETAFPDSPAGHWLQKAWPVARRSVPFWPLALAAARRSFSGPEAP